MTWCYHMPETTLDDYVLDYKDKSVFIGMVRSKYLPEYIYENIVYHNTPEMNTQRKLYPAGDLMETYLKIKDTYDKDFTEVYKTEGPW